MAPKNRSGFFGGHDTNGAPFAAPHWGWRKELWFYRVGGMACLCRSVNVWFVEFFIEKTGQAFCVNQRAILWFL